MFSDSVYGGLHKGFIELYSDRLLELVDKLNAFPGAELISKALHIRCPRPPLFTRALWISSKILTSVSET